MSPKMSELENVPQTQEVWKSLVYIKADYK